MRIRSISLARAFFETLKECCTNLACLSFFVVAVGFYSFYYAWPYMTQLPEHLSTIIVDEDNSRVSQNLTRALESAPELKVVGVTQNRAEAINRLKNSDVSSIITIPMNFARDVVAGHPTAVSLLANGNFIVIARFSMAGAAGPIQQAYSAAISKELIEGGIPLSSIEKKALEPPAVIMQNMYNTLAGYLNFVLPIVFLIIFQTAFVTGIGFLICEWFCRKDPPALFMLVLSSPRYYMAMLTAFWVLIFAWVLYTEGFSFWFHGTESMQNIPSTLAAGALYSWAIASFGAFIAMMMGRCKLIAQFFVISSIPLVFITGYLFPWQDIPNYMQFFSWFFPSTPATHAMLRTSQVGVPISYVWKDLAHLIILSLLYMTLGMIRARMWIKIEKKSIDTEPSQEQEPSLEKPASTAVPQENL